MTDLMHNDFFKGGIGVALVGAAMVLLRQIPARLWTFLVKQLTVSVEIHNDSPLFDRVTVWLDSLPQTRAMRSVIVKHTASHHFASHHFSGVVFSPSPGEHILRVDGKWVRLSRSRQSTTETSSSPYTRAAEMVRFQYVGRGQAFGRRIVDRVEGHHDAQRFRAQTVAYFRPAVWFPQQRHIRTMDSIVLPGNTADSLESDVARFLAAKAEYAALRIPYQRVYIFHGTPGSGKTSTIAALAGRFGLDIYNLNFRPYCEPHDMLGPIPSRSIIVAEDLDTVYDGRAQRDKNGGMDFATFINMLDGFRAKDEAIVILTTNHIDKLDPAIIRRANVKVEFRAADEDQAWRLFLRFFPAKNDLADVFARRAVGGMMSDLQGWLLTHREDATAAAAFTPLGEREVLGTCSTQPTPMTS